jgi:hypothetical protein
MERGAWIETQFTPWKLARGVSKRARPRADHGSCWARAGVVRRETDAKVAAITHRECGIRRRTERAKTLGNSPCTPHPSPICAPSLNAALRGHQTIGLRLLW